MLKQLIELIFGQVMPIGFPHFHEFRGCGKNSLLIRFGEMIIGTGILAGVATIDAILQMLTNFSRNLNFVFYGIIRDTPGNIQLISGFKGAGRACFPADIAFPAMIGFGLIRCEFKTGQNDTDKII